jgi:hypothetical protein
VTITILKPQIVVEGVTVWECPSCNSIYVRQKEKLEQCPECDSYQNYRPTLRVDLRDILAGIGNVEFEVRMVWRCAECETEFDEPYVKCPEANCSCEIAPQPKLVVLNPHDYQFVPKRKDTTSPDTLATLPHIPLPKATVRYDNGPSYTQVFALLLWLLIAVGAIMLGMASLGYDPFGLFQYIEPWLER